jgi:hypothetical protein
VLREKFIDIIVYVKKQRKISKKPNPASPTPRK